jgi:hypothetical protein
LTDSESGADDIMPFKVTCPDRPEDNVQKQYVVYDEAAALPEYIVVYRNIL